MAIVADSAIASAVQAELAQYAADVNRELHACVRTLLVNGTTTPQQIRVQLQDWYRNAHLLGAVLVGDVPGVQIGQYNWPGVTDVPYAADTYYAILSDASWQDPERDGIFNRTGLPDARGLPTIVYDAMTVARDRDIWTGRLTPPQSLPFAERVSRLSAYFQRNHAYRTGQKTYASRMLYFNSISHNNDVSDFEVDEATNAAAAQAFYAGMKLFAAPASTALDIVWNNDMQAQLNAWRSGLATPREYAFLNVHGLAWTQGFGAGLQMSGADYAALSPRALLVDLMSCENGQFTYADYLAGHLLFSGDTLVVRAFTMPIMVVGEPVAALPQRLLATGLTVGDIHKASGLLDAYELLGDPTLRLRQPGTGPWVAPSRSTIAFADGLANPPTLPASVNETFNITNWGTTPITISLSENQQWTTWNDAGVLMRSIEVAPGSFAGIDPLFLIDGADVLRFPVTLAPGASTEVRVWFAMSYGNALPGLYRWKAVFTTDSAAMPTFVVEASRRLN